MDSYPYLPVEIWLKIIEYLPASFFQKDIRRLTVAKCWYSLAYPIFFPDYTPKVISGFLHSRSKTFDETRSILQKSQQHVKVTVEGTHFQHRYSDTESDLEAFGLLLRRFSGLKELTFVAKWPSVGWRYDLLQGSCLPFSSIEPYMLHDRLTTVVLDLCGTSVASDYNRRYFGHFCLHIRFLLCRVQTLRVRMQRICEEALKPPSSGAEITVGEVTVNLYLGRVSEVNPKLNMSKSCRIDRCWEWNDPLHAVCEAMRVLSGGMAQPKQAEVIHLSPSGHVERVIFGKQQS